MHVTGMVFLAAGVLSLLLAVLHAIDAWQYSSAVDLERATRPVGRLDVEGGDTYYAVATTVTDAVSASSSTPSTANVHVVASAPPLPAVKMQTMGIE